MNFKAIVDEHQNIVNKLVLECCGDIQKISDLCLNAIKNNHTIFLCGNGGSAADCQHIAAEFTGRFVKERSGLPAVALTTDTSALTAIANDYGFEYIFRRQVEALVRKGDIFIGISTSGNSKNVLAAVEEAKKIGAITIGFTGKKSSNLADTTDVCLKVPSEITARIQECHILVGHMICQYVDEEFQSE